LAAVFSDIHREVIELSKAGNAKAQYQLYKLYSKAMYNICLRMLNNREEAEDLLQDSFVDAFMKLDSFRYESSFGAWLKRLVINHCINWINRKKVELSYPEDLANINMEEEELKDYDEIQYSVEKIYRAMEQLPDGYRITFSLYALEGYDHKEISGILGISESTSKSQYLRARQKINEIIKSGNNERQSRTVYS
jgi:RNA polymerase sigma-70 factor (ECF subfamily)